MVLPPLGPFHLQYKSNTTNGDRPTLHEQKMMNQSFIHFHRSMQNGPKPTKYKTGNKNLSHCYGEHMVKHSTFQIYPNKKGT
jgi:hypothetical protein